MQLFLSKIFNFRSFTSKPWFHHINDMQVTCVCVFVCVCLYSSIPEASSDCKTSETYFRGTDRRCYVVSIISRHQDISSSFLNMSYFTSEYETPACRKLERKLYDTTLQEKIIYIDIGYKSADHQTDKWQNLLVG